MAFGILPRSTLLEHELSQREFESIVSIVYKAAGISLNESKKDLVRARLAKRLRVLGLSSYTQYIETHLADTDSVEFCEFLDAISTNLTSFFRENHHFEYLADSHLPAVMKKNQGTKRIRGWSAGCSSGEEPYTLAIVLSEVLAKSATRGWDVKLLATDLSTRVLRKATAGVYDQDRVKGVSPALLGRYFEPRTLGGEDHYAVSPRLRDMIVFNRLNLIEAWPFAGPFDFIFCRNVMIYFDKPTQERLINRFHDLLAPGGILLTGHSESLTGIRHPFRFVQATIYQKAS